MSASKDPVGLAKVAAQAAANLKATGGQAIDVSERLVLAEVFLIVSGSTERQVRAIVDAVEESLHKAGARRRRREGFEGEARWVLLDYGDLVVHVMNDEDREFYALDKLWGDCPDIDLGIDFAADSVEANPLASYGFAGEVP